MSEWTPATGEEVERLFSDELERLDPVSRTRFEGIRVPLRAVPVSSDPGECVHVVAEYEGRIVYWSDVELGWEIDTLRGDGSIDCRGASQFDLTHVLLQLFDASPDPCADPDGRC